jgi:hypothetical protein
MWQAVGIKSPSLKREGFFVSMLFRKIFVWKLASQK